jgi:hypothetical protein
MKGSGIYMIQNNGGRVIYWPATFKTYGLRKCLDCHPLVAGYSVSRRIEEGG